MFVYDFLRLEVPFPTARERLLEVVPRLPARPELASLLAGPAAYTWGPPRERDAGLLVPVGWSTTRPRPLALEGDLELAPIADDGSHLSLAATCRAGTEPLGRWVDRSVLRRDAETAARSFLQALAGSFLSPQPPSPGTGGAGAGRGTDGGHGRMPSPRIGRPW